MATQIADLWGGFQPAEVRSPLSILRQQASLLGDKTGHLVEARVDSRAQYKEFFHSFRLVVPALDDYTYELFRISHTIDLYPISVRWKDERVELETEEAFVDWLSSCLSSEATKRIISTLMAQAAA
jgi:hypothetical protein